MAEQTDEERLSPFDREQWKLSREMGVARTAEAIMLQAMQLEHLTYPKKPGVLKGDKLAAKAREWALVLHGQPPIEDKQE